MSRPSSPQRVPPRALTLDHITPKAQEAGRLGEPGGVLPGSPGCARKRGSGLEKMLGDRVWSDLAERDWVSLKVAIASTFPVQTEYEALRLKTWKI